VVVVVTMMGMVFLVAQVVVQALRQAQEVRQLAGKVTQAVERLHHQQEVVVAVVVLELLALMELQPLEAMVGTAFSQALQALPHITQVVAAGVWTVILLGQLLGQVALVVAVMVSMLKALPHNLGL
jgi:hypothetical protein